MATEKFTCPNCCNKEMTVKKMTTVGQIVSWKECQNCDFRSALPAKKAEDETTNG
jgi:transcription elongation factor Elf1